MKTIKRTVDPLGIMNPGKVSLPIAPWLASCCPDILLDEWLTFGSCTRMAISDKQGTISDAIELALSAGTVPIGLVLRTRGDGCMQPISGDLDGLVWLRAG